MPQPKQKAKDRKRCQMRVATDEENRPANTTAVPSSMVRRVPMRFCKVAARGEISSAWEMDRPPIMAYSNLVAARKVSNVV
jgi:hypothetical protein